MQESDITFRLFLFSFATEYFGFATKQLSFLNVDNFFQCYNYLVLVFISCDL